MTNKTHTQGPWEVKGQNVTDQYGNRIVSTARDLSCDVWGSARENNARLIAAAPDMYEALKIWELYETNRNTETRAEAFKATAAALAKAGA